MWLCVILLLIVSVLLGGGYYAYRIGFYSPSKGRDAIPTLSAPQFDPYRKEMKRIFDQLMNRPFEFVTIQSKDGLTLSGRYYAVQDGAPLDIAFHGYRSSPLTDFSGGSELSFQLNHNLLLVDQRAHGKSQGNTITFGILERQDLLCWVDYAVSRFGKDVQIVLHGMSMGAATVLMASDLNLPENVKGIVSDCPYSTPMEIITHVSKQMPIPDFLIKPFVLFGSRIYGKFDIQEASAIDSVKRAKVPILLIHGEADSFVPCEMSARIQLANPEMVHRYTFPGAEHGISFLVDMPRYRKLVTNFMDEVLL